MQYNERAMRWLNRLLEPLSAIRNPLGGSDADGVRHTLTEESVIFLDVMKWFILSTAVGALVGVSTWIFLTVLRVAVEWTSRVPYHFLALPVAFAGSALLIRKLAPDAEGHGTEKVIEAIHKRAGRIRAAVVPIKLLATVVTIAFGGSAGKEGPCAQIGAGLASTFAGLLRFDDKDRRKLVICGISAGFASVFGTPIAGAIFGVEVLFVGSILYEVLLPSFIAGIVSFQVSSALGITYFYHPLEVAPQLSESVLVTVLAAAVFFGLVSVLLIEGMRLGQRVRRMIRLPETAVNLGGGAALIGLTFLAGRQYLGLGVDTIEFAVTGGQVLLGAFLLKILFTSVTLNFGGSGGIVTPIFFIGATAGVTFARLFDLHTPTFSVIGMTSLLAGAANTPIAASIMGVELFGPKMAPLITVAAVITFLMTGHRSVYPSQVLSVKKSEGIEVGLGGEMEDVETRFAFKKKGIIVRGRQLGRKIRGKLETPPKDEGKDE